MRYPLLFTSAVLFASPALAATGTASPAAPSAQAPASSENNASLISAAAPDSGALTAGEREQLLREIQSLRDRVSALETKPSQVAPAAAQRNIASDHNLELYGFLQLDAIQDFKRVNPDWEATLRPSRIPTIDGQFGGDGQSIFSVRQSRLGVKATGKLLNKPYEAKFEFDLYGTGADAGQTTMRVRHMYAKWGPFLAGQTNTLFMDADLFPNTIDYWGPPGMVFTRNPQLRFTFLNNNGWQAAVALEHPSNDIDVGNLRLIDEDIASNIRNDEPLPDLTAMVRYDGKWGHVQLSGLLRKVAYETVGTADNEPNGSKTGWGLNLGTAFNISLATLRIGAVYGRGIATYMNDGGMDMGPNVAVVPAPGTLILVPSAEAVKLFGMTAYVDLNWSKHFTSSIGYSFDKVDNTSFQSATAFRKGEYASANLLWHPAENVMTGGEFLWGKRTDNDGETGTDTRFQYSFKWSFSSKNIWDLIQ
jgi:hypothetical protein